MLVLLNPRAGGGRAAERWSRVEAVVRAADRTCDVVTPAAPSGAVVVVRDALARGERRFVAAGGDGTVNLLLWALAVEAGPRLGEVTLGAVGLGSSNDFHKPVGARGLVAGVPCRLDFAHARSADVCRLRVRSAEGGVRARPWMINASIGATADGNHYYNTGTGRVLRALRRRSMDAALGWAAARAVAGNRPRPFTLALDDGPRFTLALRNLGVVKNPHFSGALRYDSPLAPADGAFFVHAVCAVGACRLWATLAALARGRFMGRPGTLSWRVRRLTVVSRRPFAVEADGEVLLATAAGFSVRPAALRVCA